MNQTEKILEFDRIKENWKELALTEWARKEIEETLPEYRCRLQVKPGLTGLSQVNGCYNQTFAERLAYDVEYMQKRSIDMDLHCIFKTVWVVLNGDGAR